MPDDTTNPTNNEPPVEPVVSEPNSDLSTGPALSGMKNIQPISENITIDPPARPVTSQPVTPPSQPEPPRIDTSDTDEAMNATKKSVHKQTIVSVIISGIGLILVILTVLLFLNVYANRATQEVSAWNVLIYTIQGAIGVGLVFRKELLRWLIVIFAAAGLILNIYTSIMEASVFSAVSSNPTPLYVILSITGQFIIPLAIIIVLNLRVVKNSFH